MVLFDDSILDEDGQPIFRSADYDEIDDTDLKRNYKQYGCLFSLRIHHGGFFDGFPGRQYLEGKEAIVDFLDVDKWSIHDFNYYVTKLGYHKDKIMFYHWLKPDMDSLDFGLAPFGSDQDVITMISYVGKYHMFDIYIEHEVSVLYNVWNASNVVIEELPDDTEIEVENVVKPGKFTKLLLEGPSENLSVDEVQETCENLREDDVPSVQENVDEVQERCENLREDDVPSVQENVENELPNVQQTGEGLGKGPSVQQTGEGSGDGPSGQQTAKGSGEGPSVKHVVDDYFSNNLEQSDMLNDVYVDMSDFKDTIIDKDDFWLKKSVESGVGNLEMNEEVLGLDFDQFDSGDDEDGNSRRSKLRKLKGKHVEGNTVRSPFYPGQAFLNPKQVRDLVRQHGVETRRELKFAKNEPRRLRVVCSGQVPGGMKDKRKEKESLNSGDKVDEGNIVIDQEATCPWVLFVSKTDQDSHLTVKTFKDTHTCLQTRSLKWASSTFLSHHIGDTVSADPEISGKALLDQLQRHFELGLGKQVVYRAKNKAMTKLRGDFVEQYAHLRSYILELQARNPETTVKLAVEEDPNPEAETRVFQRIYICLGPLKKGFKAGGRELLGLDGAFMKGPYPGQVLVAVGVDGNNGLYPLAFGIVEAENRRSWTWFLTCLGEDLDLTTMSNFTFISDRQKGVIPAIASLYPNAEHRYCLRHIHENLKAFAKQGDMYRDLLWKCAISTTVPEFEKAMDEIKRLSTRVHDWLRQIPPRHWCRAYFSGRAKCDILLNNICESFNAKLVDARDKPIITCLEYIREYIMKKLVLVQEVIDKSKGLLTPTASLIFETTQKEAGKYNAIWNGEDLYQVKGPWQDQAVVDMRNRSCSCRKWDLTGIPCKHVVCALWNMDKHGRRIGILENWVHKAYRLDTWKHVYSFKINPVTGPSTWPISDVPTKLLPPHHHTQVGRPTKKRRRGADEKRMVERGRLSRFGKTVTCAKCNQKGHNSRNCKGQREQPGPSQQKKPKKPTKFKKQRTQGSEAVGGSSQGPEPGVGVGGSSQGAQGKGGGSTSQGTQGKGGGSTSQGTQVGVGGSQVTQQTPTKQFAGSQRLNTSPRLVVKRFGGIKF